MVDSVVGLRSTTSDAQLNSRMLLEQGARAHGDQQVITDTESGKHVTTYREMWERTQRAANVLEDLGVEPGDVVGVYGYSTAWYIELIYAISSIGATAFTINLDLPLDHKRFCLDHVKDNAPFDTIFVDKELADDLHDVLTEEDDYQFVVMGTDEEIKTELDPSYIHEQLLAGASASYDFPEVDERTACILMFTTGTTGKPKAIAHSHRWLYLHTIGMIATQGFHPQDNHLMVPPLFHLGWLLWSVAPAAGSKLTLPGTTYPESLLPLLIEEDVTFSAGVPTLFTRAVEVIHQRREEGEDVDLEGLNIAFAGQAPPSELMRDCESLGATTYQLYGFSECGSHFVSGIHNELRTREMEMSESELFEYKSKKVGYPVPGVDIDLFDVESGEPVPLEGGAEGELAYRTPWGIDAYWEMPEKTADAVTEDGYTKVGDLVSIDEHWNLEYRDRIKDVIKSGGEWIPSPILDDLISNHPDVSAAVVIAADHDEWMERPVAVIEPVEGIDAETFEFHIEAHLSQYVESGDIERWWIPDAVVVVDEIPKTSVGKFNKKALRDAYADVLTNE